MKTIPFQFYDEPIEVIFSATPVYEKSPTCPQAFIWRNQTYPIEELLEEWVDFRRRGKMDRNMKPAHAATANLRGSWGVGRYNFRVRVCNGLIFELYYDRAPESCDDRKGNWFLLGERKQLF